MLETPDTIHKVLASMQPRMDGCLHCIENTLDIFSKDFTTIGGTLDYDDYSRTPKPEEIEDILNKACEVVPALRVRGAGDGGYQGGGRMMGMMVVIESR